MGQVVGAQPGGTGTGCAGPGRPAGAGGSGLERALATAEAIQDDWTRSVGAQPSGAGAGAGRPARAGGSGTGAGAGGGRSHPRTMRPGRRRSARWRRRWVRWPRPASRSGRLRLERALAAAEAIQDDGARSEALSQVAQALVHRRPARAGGRDIGAGTGGGRSHPGRWARSWALSQVAQALGPRPASPSGRWRRPKPSRTMGLGRGRSARWRRAGPGGQPERATSGRWRRPKPSRTMGPGRRRSARWHRRLAQAGQPERAAQALERALAAAEAIQDDGARSQALTPGGAGADPGRPARAGG